MNSARDVQSRATLHSWKEIASYLGVTVRSVQRWEKESGLPVYRQGGGKSARVFAHTDELRGWMDATDHDWVFIVNAIRGTGGVGAVSRACCLLETTTIAFHIRTLPSAPDTGSGLTRCGCG